MGDHPIEDHFKHSYLQCPFFHSEYKNLLILKKWLIFLEVTIFVRTCSGYEKIQVLNDEFYGILAGPSKTCLAGYILTGQKQAMTELTCQHDRLLFTLILYN